MRVLADTSEDIEHFAPVRFRILDAIGRDQRQSCLAGKIDKLPVDLFLPANEMPLNLDENIFAPEYPNRCSRGPVGRSFFCGGRSEPDWHFVACGYQGFVKQSHHSFRKLRQLIPFDLALAFFTAQMRLRQE